MTSRLLLLHYTIAHCLLGMTSCPSLGPLDVTAVCVDFLSHTLALRYDLEDTGTRKWRWHESSECPAPACFYHSNRTLIAIRRFYKPHVFSSRTLEGRWH